MANRLRTAPRRFASAKRPWRAKRWDSTGARTSGCPIAAWGRRSKRGAQLAGVIRQQRPRWLFAPYWEDAHPDHVAATQLVEAARFWSKLTKSDLPGQPHHPERIYNYYCVHLRLAPQPAFVLDITDQWEQKLAAIRAYESQFITGRPTTPPTFLDGLRDEAAYWGKTIGVRYAEPFACREPLGLQSMAGLV